MADAPTLLAAAALIGAPAWLVARALWSGVRQVRAERAVAERGRQRSLTRSPAPGTIEVEGVVEAEPEVLLLERRQHGCLGGPFVYEVSGFSLRLGDGRVVRVEVGPDPDFPNAFRLPPPARLVTGPPVPAMPRPTGGGTSYRLQGTLRVSGVVFVDDARLAPPDGYSAVVHVS